MFRHSWLDLPLSILVGFVVFAGCTATYTVPLTMPIWLVLGVIFMVRQTVYQTWRLFAVTGFWQLLAISAWMFASWLELRSCRICDPTQIRLFGQTTLVTAILAGLTLWTDRLARAAVDEPERRTTLLTVQAVVVVSAIWAVVRLANS